MGEQDRHDLVAVEGHLSSEHPVGNASQGIDVGQVGDVAKESVVRLDIAVDHAVVVHDLKGVAGLDEQRDGLGEGEGAAFQHRPQIFTFQQFHGDVLVVAKAA